VSAAAAIPDKDAPKVIKLLDRLNDHEDVQQVHSNFEISDEALDALEAAS